MITFYCQYSTESDVCVRYDDTFEYKGYRIYLPIFKHLIKDGKFIERFDVDGPMKAATILMMLRHKGCLVPQKVINQLIKQARSSNK